MKKQKIAIIGAATGQLPLCLKAKEMDLETFCFAYEKGAICKDVVDHFYPISIFEMDRIVELCKEIEIDGVVSNASDATAEVVAYVSEKLNLPGTSYDSLLKVRDKYVVRSMTNKIDGLKCPSFYKYENMDQGIYPCVVKPCKGGAKKGVSFVASKAEFNQALEYASSDNTGDIIVEEYIVGKELSVECLSSNGKHYIIQITDKDSSAAPHFVELGHHQPAELSESVHKKIHKVIPELLAAIGYDNGASHIEVKYNGEDVFLIEANLRGGGDNISNKLVYMSSGIDYLRCMIEVALGNFKGVIQTAPQRYAGIYYLCKQTERYLSFFELVKSEKWIVEKEIYSTDLQESHSNYERNGYIMYCSDHKIKPEDYLL